MYELATWLHLGKSCSTVRWLPVARAMIITVMFLGFQAVCVLLTFASELDMFPFVLAGLVSASVVAPVPAFLIRRLARDLRRMPKQVASFSVQAAECFCCSHNHVHPDTGDCIPCDRELVFGRLAEWFKREGTRTPQFEVAAGEPPAEPELGEHLQIFDEYVRERFGAELRGKADELPLRYLDALALSLPVAFYFGDRFTVVEFLGHLNALRFVAHFVTLIFVVNPLAVKMMLLINFAVDSLCVTKVKPATDLLLTGVACLAWLLVVMAQWVALEVAVSGAHLLPQLVVSLFLIGLTFLLYWEPWRLCRHAR